MDKYEGMNKPKTVSYSVGYEVRERWRGKNNRGIQQKIKKDEAVKYNKRNIYLGIRIAICLLLLFFPLMASFTNWEAAATVDDFLRRELTREISLPFLNADAKEYYADWEPDCRSVPYDYSLTAMVDYDIRT